MRKLSLTSYLRSKCQPSKLGTVKFAVGLVACLTLIGCGGGGGGGSDDTFSGAALVAISSTPSEIDAGDRTKLVIDISQVHPDGIALKLRFPDGLRYVANSSVVVVNDNESDSGPAVNVSKDGYVYLVYYFTKARFGENSSGELQIELEGVTGISDGDIEVDADVDDPLISNSSEFSVDNPEFQTQDASQIRVRQ
jgi:hypothetical protein